MQPYRLLIPDGNSFRIKKFLSFFHIIIAAWLFIGIVVLKYSDNIKTGISLIVFALLLGTLLVLRPSKTRIFPHEKIIVIDTGVRGKVPERYNFSDFVGFDLQVIKWIGGISVNATLYRRFSTTDKTKRYELGSSVSKKKMQQLSNELTPILKNKE